MKYVIVGLGNPGEQYAHSPHNAGRLAVEHFARYAGVEEWKEHKKSNADVAKGDFGTLVLPNTYMNRSGSAAAHFVKSPKAAQRLVVVYDDIDLPLGKVKISFSRGSGGHKGVESIARALKTRDFVRLRIGVAPTTPSGKLKKPRGEAAVEEYLLKPLRKPQFETLTHVFKTTNKALEAIISEGRERAMNEFN